MLGNQSADEFAPITAIRCWANYGEGRKGDWVEWGKLSIRRKVHEQTLEITKSDKDPS